MQTKSGGAIAAATALVLVALGGSAVAAHVVTSGLSAPLTHATPTAGPVRVGAQATARVPGTPAAPGQGGLAPSAAASSAPATPGSGRTGRPAPAPGESPGTPPPVSITGESPATLALGNARAADEALPHSPQLLAELADPIGRGHQGGRGTTTAVPGIDVAAFQHPNGAVINWADVAAAGYKFVAVKATEGDYYVNPWAASDMAVARSVGMYVTPYTFAIPNVSSGSEQAQFAVEYSGYASSAQTLPLMLDIEYDPYVSIDGTNMCYGLSPAQMTSWIAAFVSTARSLTGQNPVIYTTADWWDTCTGDSTAFGADPMWIAAYGFTSPPMPPGWASWTFWQDTSSGTVPGIATPGGTDLDTFNTALAGLIDPGSQQASLGAKVALQLTSLAALARQPLNFTATGLPPGLTISDGGMISGVVGGVTAQTQTTTSTTYKVTISAANPTGAAVGSVSFTWKVSGS